MEIKADIDGIQSQSNQRLHVAVTIAHKQHEIQMIKSLLNINRFLSREIQYTLETHLPALNFCGKIWISFFQESLWYKERFCECLESHKKSLLVPPVNGKKNQIVSVKYDQPKY